MKRVFSDFAFSDAPRQGCWWDQTCDLPARATLDGDLRVEVAIIGGGFTGLSAALHLARAGVGVAVIEARYAGWGASGRNGGFCCLGGGRLGDTAIDAQFGTDARRDYRATELAAIDLVDGLIRDNAIDVDRHSSGETQLAHRPKDMTMLRKRAAEIKQSYGVYAEVIEREALAEKGLNAGFHGGLTTPIGFALNPRKYLRGLAELAERAGVTIYEGASATQIARAGAQHRLMTSQGSVVADKVIVATNGYSSDDVPDWLGGRYMPAQTTVIVTRPITERELAAQGWTSDQMVYDTRNLLHYFRLMPDRRMLFGARGGLFSSAAAEARAATRVRRDFDRMFPHWQHIETPFSWSGLVCMARDQMPFVGPVPDQSGLFAGLCYHGNGVAMGSYSGALLADLVRGVKPDRPYSKAMQRPLRKFELGPLRKLMMPFAYAGFALADA